MFELSEDTICATDDFGATFGLHRPLSPNRMATGLPGFAQHPSLSSFDGHTLLTSTFVDAMFWSSVLREEERSPESVFYHRGNVIVVPSFRTGGPLCPWCVALRLAAASAEPVIQLHFLSGGMVYASGIDCHPAAMHPEVVRSLLAARSALPRPDLVVSSRSLTALSRPIRHHEVRAVPGTHGRHHVKNGITNTCPTWRSQPPPAMTTPNKLNLVDELVGPIKSLLRDEDGSGVVTFVADTGHLGHFVKWAPDATGSGTAMTEDAASNAAIGEAVERYCGNYVPIDKLVERSESDLHGHEQRIVTPADLGSNYYAQRFPETFRRSNYDVPEYWLEGNSLLDEAPVWVPAEAAVLNFTRRSGRRPQFPVPLTGIAAGATLNDAIHAALLEIVERDAVMRWWFGRTPASEILSAPNEVTRLTQFLSPSVKTRWLSLESDFGIPVVAGCLYDDEHQIVTAGFAARTILASAMQKAMFEAVQSRAMILQFLDPRSAMRVAVDTGKLSWPVLPHDPDRGYRACFRADFSDMDQLLHNVQYYLDPSTLPDAVAGLEPEAPARKFAVLDTEPRSTLNELPHKMHARAGVDVYAVDLTTDDVRSTHSVARVIVPGLVGMVATAHTPVWHPRLAKLPDLHVAPLPHS